MVGFAKASLKSKIYVNEETIISEFSMNAFLSRDILTQIEITYFLESISGRQTQLRFYGRDQNLLSYSMLESILNLIMEYT